MSEHQKPKATLRVGVRIECGCGWHSQAYFGSFSENIARLQWHQHLADDHRTPPTVPAPQAQAVEL